ncbi:MAG: NADH-quinone oxidoreductase subunit K [Sphingomonadaceae bacterium]
MSLIYALSAAIIVGSAIFMILSRNIVRILLGLSLLATGTNLILFLTGRLRSTQPPLVREGAQTLGPSADPVPQALVLTAIVIGFALTMVLAALALRAWRDEGTIDIGEIQAAEAPDDPDPKAGGPRGGGHV